MAEGNARSGPADPEAFLFFDGVKSDIFCPTASAPAGIVQEQPKSKEGANCDMLDCPFNLVPEKVITYLDYGVLRAKRLLSIILYRWNADKRLSQAYLSSKAAKGSVAGVVDEERCRITEIKKTAGGVFCLSVWLCGHKI